MSRRTKLAATAISLLLAGLSATVRADLLDEEATPPGSQAPGPSGSGPAAPTPGKKRVRPPKPALDSDEPELGVGGPTPEGAAPPQAEPNAAPDKATDVKATDTKVKAPTPHPKDTGTTASTTVIPPKNPDKKSGKKKEAAVVHFDSKGLKGLRTKGMVELEQDVVVTQDDLRMEADHAQVFFDEGQKDKKERGLIKVIADGNPVKIFGVDENSGEKFKAFGNQGVFLAKEKTVVLEGNARLWRGDDSVIRSRKITYEMDTGWIRADRVAGELQPTDKGPAASKSKKTAPVEKPSPPVETPPAAPAPGPAPAKEKSP